MEKLEKRGDEERWALCRDLPDHEVLPHPCFSIVDGGIAEWEKRKAVEETKGKDKGKGKKKQVEIKGGQEASVGKATTTVAVHRTSKKRGQTSGEVDDGGHHDDAPGGWWSGR